MAKTTYFFVIEAHQSVDDALAVFHKAFVCIRIHAAGSQRTNDLCAAFGIDSSPATKTAVCFLLF